MTFKASNQLTHIEKENMKDGGLGDNPMKTSHAW